ncbi:hypothetical protein B0H12DRAFT_1074782 [Mycena haematopus]|nr:hypothetical protein B0H12DRAFT_1074782 [Mycena haematopus]
MDIACMRNAWLIFSPRHGAELILISVQANKGVALSNRAPPIASVPTEIDTEDDCLDTPSSPSCSSFSFLPYTPSPTSPGCQREELKIPQHDFPRDVSLADWEWEHPDACTEDMELSPLIAPVLSRSPSPLLHSDQEQKESITPCLQSRWSSSTMSSIVHPKGRRLRKESFSFVKRYFGLSDTQKKAASTRGETRRKGKRVTASNRGDFPTLLSQKSPASRSAYITPHRPTRAHRIGAAEVGREKRWTVEKGTNRGRVRGDTRPRKPRTPARCWAFGGQAMRCQAQEIWGMERRGRTRIRVRLRSKREEENTGRGRPTSSRSARGQEPQGVERRADDVDVERQERQERDGLGDIATHSTTRTANMPSAVLEHLIAPRVTEVSASGSEAGGALGTAGVDDLLEDVYVEMHEDEVNIREGRAEVRRTRLGTRSGSRRCGELSSSKPAASSSGHAIVHHTPTRTRTLAPASSSAYVPHIRRERESETREKRGRKESDPGGPSHSIKDGRKRQNELREVYSPAERPHVPPNRMKRLGHEDAQRGRVKAAPWPGHSADNEHMDLFSNRRALSPFKGESQGSSLGPESSLLIPS